MVAVMNKFSDLKKIGYNVALSAIKICSFCFTLCLIFMSISAFSEIRFSKDWIMFGETLAKSIYYSNFLYCMIGLLGIIFALDGKFKWLKNIEKVLWIIAFITMPYCLLNIPSVAEQLHP